MELGVSKQILRFTSGPADVYAEGADVELDVFVEEDEVLGDVTLYTLDADRLRSLLELAVSGEDIDGLILSLDAAALASEPES